MQKKVTNAANAEEILNALLESGKLNIETIANETNMIEFKRKESAVLAVHTRPITQQADGQYHTYVFSETAKNHRIHKHKREYQDLIELLYDWYNLDAKPETLETFYPKWLSVKKNETRRDTYIKRIESTWRSHYMRDSSDKRGAYKNPIIEVPLEDLTPAQLKVWALELIRKNNFTAKAYYDTTVIMRQALAWAVECDIIPRNPFESVKIGSRVFIPEQKKPDEQQVFTAEEVKLFEALAWEDFRTKGRKVYRLAPLAALFFFYTGVRVGEVTGFHFSDKTDDIIFVRGFCEKDSHKYVPYAKTDAGTNRPILLTKQALKVIEAAEEFPREKDAIYIFSEYSRPLPSAVVEDYYRRYCDIIHTARKTPHCGRKTYISTLLDGGVNLNTVRKLVGHADERTTLHNYYYDRSTTAEKRKTIENALSYTSGGNRGQNLVE